jgi:hypothetical protein
MSIGLCLPLNADIAAVRIEPRYFEIALRGFDPLAGLDQHTRRPQPDRRRPHHVEGAFELIHRL